MKVSELMETLSRCDPGDLVILSRDGEGNGYSPLSDCHAVLYVPDTTWSGEVYDSEAECRQDVDEGYADDPDKVVKAICLWPTN